MDDEPIGSIRTTRNVIGSLCSRTNPVLLPAVVLASSAGGHFLRQFFNGFNPAATVG